MDLVKYRWHRYHYKNLTYLFISFLVAMFLLQSASFRSVVTHLGTYGYIGALLGGALFVSTFTVSLGTVILMLLAKTLNPVVMCIIAGMGAVMGDLAIFQFIRMRGLETEIKHFFNYFGGAKIKHLIHTKFFSWTLPVVGALIIASPLPDELGVSLMGISRLKTSQFVILSFILNSIGIFIVVTAASMIK